MELIRRLGSAPRAHEAHVALMQAVRHTSAGDVVPQAVGEIENALVDVKARAARRWTKQASSPTRRAASRSSLCPPPVARCAAAR
jgi:L-alanine-DL-glutamate epimerase-like enolase superfamily enzyme